MIRVGQNHDSHRGSCSRWPCCFRARRSGRRRSLQNELVGTVGPGFTIALTRDGQPAHLDPGTYTITVNDLSIEHNFHLTGPGVNQATTVETSSTVTWTVTFTDGTYRYVCDPHANIMRGSFTVGNRAATASAAAGTAGEAPDRHGGAWRGDQPEDRGRPQRRSCRCGHVPHHRA